MEVQTFASSCQWAIHTLYSQYTHIRIDCLFIGVYVPYQPEGANNKIKIFSLLLRVESFEINRNLWIYRVNDYIVVNSWLRCERNQLAQGGYNYMMKLICKLSILMYPFPNFFYYFFSLNYKQVYGNVR